MALAFGALLTLALAGGALAQTPPPSGAPPGMPPTASGPERGPIIKLDALSRPTAPPPGMPPAATGPEGGPIIKLGVLARHQTLLVGPTRNLKNPSDAAQQAGTGDSVIIDPGSYFDCATWRGNNMTLRAAGGEVLIHEKTCRGMGIWIIEGFGNTVEGIHFAGAKVADHNGAGIRLNGGDLTVRNAVFENNENGILAAPLQGLLTIEHSRFVGNGSCEGSCAHGIYASGGSTVTVRDSVFIGQHIGHHIKSRARSTVVTGNRIEDGPTGTASYLVDVSNGGNVLIEHNILDKGPHSDNQRYAIAIGAEGATNPTQSIIIRDNEFHSRMRDEVVFVMNRTRTLATIENNMLCGQVIPLEGPGAVKAPRPCAKP